MALAVVWLRKRFFFVPPKKRKRFFGDRSEMEAGCSCRCEAMGKGTGGRLCHACRILGCEAQTYSGRNQSLVSRRVVSRSQNTNYL
jgi:hypothetical protein